MPLMLKAVVPTLVRVTVFGGLSVPIVPIATTPKLKLVGESFAVVPIPLSVTFCGLPAALSLMLSAAVRIPDAVGLNVTLMLQLEPTASELPHVWDCEKSTALVPVIDMLVMVNEVVHTALIDTYFSAIDIS